MEVLGKLKENRIPTNVITSRTIDVAVEDLKRLDLLRFFDRVVTCEDTEKHKPDPDPILYYMETAKVRAEDCLYIGDTSADRDCAAAAGILFLLAG